MRTLKSDIESFVERLHNEGLKITNIATRLHTSTEVIHDIFKGVWKPKYYPCTRNMWAIAGFNARPVVKAFDWTPIAQIPVDNHGEYQDPILALDADCIIRLAFWSDKELRWLSSDGIRTEITHGIEVFRPRLDSTDVEYLHGQEDNAK